MPVVLSPSLKSHDDAVKCEQAFVGTVGRLKLEQFRRSSPGSLSGPIVLPSELSSCSVSFTTGGSPRDRAIGFGDRPSMIVLLRAVEVVLSKEAKYRLPRARISSSFRRSCPYSSLMYCALPTFLLCNFHQAYKFPYQPFMSPVLENSSSSQAYTPRYLSSAACMTSLRFLHAFRNAQKAEPPAKAPCTAVRAPFLSFQASLNWAYIALFSKNPDRRHCLVLPGITSPVERRSVSVKRVACSPTVPPSLACVS